MLNVIALFVLVSFLLRQKGLAADRAPELGNVAPGCHCNCYADMIFNEFKAQVYKYQKSRYHPIGQGDI